MAYEEYLPPPLLWTITWVKTVAVSTYAFLAFALTRH